MALASISISSILDGLCLNSGVHVQFHEEYVLKFCILLLFAYLRGLCMHIQFPKDMFTSMVIILNEKLTQGASQHVWGLFDCSDSQESFHW